MEVGDWDPPTPKRMALVKNFVGNKLMERGVQPRGRIPLLGFLKLPLIMVITCDVCNKHPCPN